MLYFAFIYFLYVTFFTIINNIIKPQKKNNLYWTSVNVKHIFKQQNNNFEFTTP